MGIIKKMDILVGMRMHALIFAEVQAVPVVERNTNKGRRIFKGHQSSFRRACRNHELDNLIKTVRCMDKRDMVKDELKKISSV
jgi:polysaccharide pyruvyl transferase WcaK-like protein